MQVEETKDGHVLVIGVKGRLDSNTSGDLEKRILALIDSGEKRLLIDFSDLDYISSAGLRVFLLAAKKSRAVNGKVVLSSLKSHIMEVFDIAGFSTILPIYATRDEACAVLQS